MEVRNQIKARLVEVREASGFTQTEVARYLQMAVGRYQHYEAGRALPNIETLLNLVQLYLLSGVDELIHGHKQPNKPDVECRYRRLPLEKRKIVDFILEQ